MVMELSTNLEEEEEEEEEDFVDLIRGGRDERKAVTWLAS